MILQKQNVFFYSHKPSKYKTLGVVKTWMEIKYTKRVNIFKAKNTNCNKNFQLHYFTH